MDDKVNIWIMEQRDNKLEWSLIYKLVKSPTGPQVIFYSPSGYLHQDPSNISSGKGEWIPSLEGLVAQSEAILEICCFIFELNANFTF